MSYPCKWCNNPVLLPDDTCDGCRAEHAKHSGFGKKLTEPQVNVDPNIWQQWAARSGAIPVKEPITMLQRAVEAREHGTIFYAMTPQRFVLEIPVEALAALSPDAHTRMLDMLTDWITRHKPLPVLVSVPQQAKP